MKKDRKNLRWGYSTGACAAAAAKAAWIRLTRGGAPQSIWVHFLDGRERELPLLQSGAGHMAAIRKNGGDDPDCTHGATLYADIRACLSGEIRAEDYVLQIGNGTLILRGAEGIGLGARLRAGPLGHQHRPPQYDLRKSPPGRVQLRMLAS